MKKVHKNNENVSSMMYSNMVFNFYVVSKIFLIWCAIFEFTVTFKVD